MAPRSVNRMSAKEALDTPIIPYESAAKQGTLDTVLVRPKARRPLQPCGLRGMNSLRQRKRQIDPQVYRTFRPIREEETERKQDTSGFHDFCVGTQNREGEVTNKQAYGLRENIPNVGKHCGCQDSRVSCLDGTVGGLDPLDNCNSGRHIAKHKYDRLVQLDINIECSAMNQSSAGRPVYASEPHNRRAAGANGMLDEEQPTDGSLENIKRHLAPIKRSQSLDVTAGCYSKSQRGDTAPISISIVSGRKGDNLSERGLRKSCPARILDTGSEVATEEESWRIVAKACMQYTKKILVVVLHGFRRGIHGVWPGFEEIALAFCYCIVMYLTAAPLSRF